MTSIDPGYAALPDDDEFETEILPVRRSRRLPLLTALLALSLVAAGAFIGGVEIQKHYGGATSNGNAATANSRLAGFAAARGRTGSPTGAPAAGAAGRFAAAGTTGVVTLIKGSMLYLTDFSGNIVKVSTRGSKVTKTVAASVRAVHPGDTVVVRGAKQKNGTYRASSITLGDAGGGLFGGNG